MVFGISFMMGIHYITAVKESGAYDVANLKKDLLSSAGVGIFPAFGLLIYNKYFSGGSSFFVKKEE